MILHSYCELVSNGADGGIGLLCAACAGGKGVAEVIRLDVDDIDEVSLLKSDSEEERGITLGNAPGAPGVLHIHVIYVYVSGMYAPTGLLHGT